MKYESKHDKKRGDLDEEFSSSWGTKLANHPQKIRGSSPSNRILGKTQTPLNRNVEFCLIKNGVVLQ